MKKTLSVISVVVLVCFASAAFGAGAASLAEQAKAAAGTTAKSEATKALTGQTVIGKITKIDAKAKQIVVNGQTIIVKSYHLADLKVGEEVKVTLAAGTQKAEKIVSVGKKALKEKTKKEVGQAKGKAVQAATGEAVKKLSQ
jgi:hypothetical protein